MTDIFQHWKDNKFIVAPPFATYHCGRSVVLTDIAFWVQHIDDLQVWCQDNGCTVQGMTVDVPTDELLTAFFLKWS